MAWKALFLELAGGAMLIWFRGRLLVSTFYYIILPWAMGTDPLVLVLLLLQA